MNSWCLIYTIISQSAVPETASDIPTEELTHPPLLNSSNFTATSPQKLNSLCVPSNQNQEFVMIFMILKFQYPAWFILFFHKSLEINQILWSALQL